MAADGGGGGSAGDGRDDRGNPFSLDDRDKSFSHVQCARKLVPVAAACDGGDERPQEPGRSSRYDIEMSAAARLAQVWKANPHDSHNFTSGLGGVE
jgi:hypothetical protein